MKPHVRYGQTAHSMAHTSTPPSSMSLPVSAVRGGGVSGSNHHQQHATMIEEYKLEEQLTPFYESTASLSARCYGSSSSSSSAVNSASTSGGVKPALRTVSIMETLSELTAAGRTSQSQVQTEQEQQQHPIKNSSASSALKNSFPIGTSIVRRKKASSSSTNVASASVSDDHTAAMSSFLDLQQWYPKRPVPSLQQQQQQQRVWDVSRLSSKQGVGHSAAAATTGRKGRSVEDILVSAALSGGASVPSVNGTTTAHGYGSLERRRRRRPGARSGMAAVSSSRRVQTDWEQEEDEEDDESANRLAISSPVGRRMVESNDHYPVVPPLFQLRSRKTTPASVSNVIAHVESSSAASAAAERERERARQSYKPPSEWFIKKKRSPPRVEDITITGATLHAHRPRPLLAGGAIKTLRPSNNRSYRSSSSSGANQERGQTPDWIHQIFQVARRGDLLKLQRALAGMESTLARNLSDHRGNNLLHVVAGAGDADALAWLCSAFGPPMQDALMDENKRGLTPVVAAIQAGHLEALQFLVEHTSVRQRLAPVDGDRSILHVAAKYGKIDLVAWLAQYMESHGLEVDLRDHCGHSPLHLAARAGQASAVAILVAHGADVTAKNDMGHRPLDLASANGHVGVAQLLRLHDAALCLSAEALEATHELDATRTDYADLRSHFRDVLVVGKRLAKERDEMCRQLGRLYEDATSVHQGLLLELRTLHRDLAGVRDRVTSSRKAGEIADRNLDESVAVVEALHDKWLSQQRGWFSSSLADMEHRLLLAEEGWKRLRTSNGAGLANKHPLAHDRSRSANPPIRPHELLRSRLAAVNAQASGMQCDAAALSSSDGSLYSGCCHSECSDHEANDDDGRNPRDPETVDHHRSMDDCFSALPRTDREQTQWNRGTRTTTAPASNRSGKSSSAKEALNDNVYNTLQAAVRKMNSSAPVEATANPTPKSKLSPMMAAVERKKAPPPIPPLPPPMSHRREELRKRLQEVKLTSESGNASVIEVIEPTSSSEDGEDDYAPGSRPMPRDQSTPLRPSSSSSGALATAGARSFNASFTEELEKARQHGQHQQTYAKTTSSMNQLHRSAMSEHYGRTTSGKGSSSSSSLLLAEPDLLAGTVLPTTAVTSRSCHDLAVQSMSIGGSETAEDADANQSRSHSSLSSSNATAVTAVAAAGSGRKKSAGGFLTKFALKARWPSKRKANLDPATVSSVQDATSPDLSLEYRDGVNSSSTNEDETNVSNSNSAAGVVAGLSQMFEDLSAKSVKATVITTGNDSNNRPSPSRNSFTSAIADYQRRGEFQQGEGDQEEEVSEDGEDQEEEEEEEEEEVMDLPPSTSPPPVPLEIETYNSMSPSSQETQSSISGSSSSMQQPPPPPRSSANLSSSSKMVDSVGIGIGGGSGCSSSTGGPGSNVTGTGATPSSSASSSTSASHGGVESLSVAASEDSGIVMARPASSASKSDSSPRHLVTSTLSPSAASSSVSVYGYNNNNNNNNNNNLNSFSPLRKASLVGGGGGVGVDRLSPAPSDLAKSESMRHFRQLARIEEAAAAAAAAAGSASPSSANEETNKPQVGNQSLRMEPTKGGGMDEAVGHHLHQSSGQILTWREAKLKNQVVTPPPLEERLNKARVRLEEKSIRTLKKRHHVSERPWYDVSDDESETLLTPERLTKLKTSLSSSDTASTASSADEDVPV